MVVLAAVSNGHVVIGTLQLAGTLWTQEVDDEGATSPCCPFQNRESELPELNSVVDLRKPNRVGSELNSDQMNGAM